MRARQPVALLAALAIAVIGVIVVGAGGIRPGGVILGAAALLAAALRWTRPVTSGDWLIVRTRAVDVSVLAGVGVGIVTLSVWVPLPG